MQCPETKQSLLFFYKLHVSLVVVPNTEIYPATWDRFWYKYTDIHTCKHKILIIFIEIEIFFCS